MFLLHIFEWAAMYYIMNTQHHRTVNQILYEHNAENMNDRSEGINYRKNEIRIANVFMGFTAVFTIVFLVVFYNFVFLWKEWSIWGVGIIYVVQAMLVSLFFFILMFHMRKYHRYEYNRVKRQMLFYFLLVTCNLVLYLAFLISDTSTHDLDSYIGRINECTGYHQDELDKWASLISK